MSKTLFIFAFIFLSVDSSSQELSEQKLRKIIDSYKSNIESAIVIKDCGHILDSPAFAAKQFENTMLDAAFRFNSKEREELTKDIHTKVIKKKIIVKNHPLEQDALKILDKITKQLPSKNKSFKLTIIKSEEINAFVIIGGYLYLTTGLLDFIDSLDELAFIIGHEISHEYKLHTQRKITKLLLSSSIFGIIKTKDFQKIALVLSSSLSAPFDQIDEYEADKYGFLLAKKAGYDVKKFGDFFKKMEKYEKRNLISKITSTHPFAKHRKKCLNKYTE